MATAIGTKYLLAINGTLLKNCTDLQISTESGKIELLTKDELIGYQEGTGKLTISATAIVANGAPEFDFWNNAQPGSPSCVFQFQIGNKTVTQDGWFTNVTFSESSGQASTVQFEVTLPPKKAE